MTASAHGSRHDEPIVLAFLPVGPPPSDFGSHEFVRPSYAERDEHEIGIDTVQSLRRLDRYVSATERTDLLRIDVDDRDLVVAVIFLKKKIVVN